MDRYPDIGEPGLIGDLQTAALVSTDGTIDWFCCPRFDSPSIFASLLDRDRGGHFHIGPDRDDYISRQLYFPDTAILTTRFLIPDGVGEVLDYMPVVEGRATDRHRLVRLVRMVRGTMRFRMEIQPRFDYGRKPHEVHLSEEGALFAAPRRFGGPLSARGRYLPRARWRRAAPHQDLARRRDRGGGDGVCGWSAQGGASARVGGTVK